MGIEFGDVGFSIQLLGSSILAVLFVLLLILFLWKKRSLSYLLCLAIFSYYLLRALDKVFFPIWLGSDYADAMRQLPFTTNINLIPFYFGPYGTLESSLETLALNALLTIPFGFGINFLIHIKPKRMLWIALAVGLFTEGGQLLISLFLGYVYRIVDMNDVIMNALGVIVGYILFRIFAWFYVWIIGRFAFKHWGIIGYIYEISNRA